jgi:hypothetical protein
MTVHVFHFAGVQVISLDFEAAQMFQLQTKMVESFHRFVSALRLSFL